MRSMLGSKSQRSQDSSPSARCVLWPVDIKLTHLDWTPEATLVHFQGRYLTTCELDYNILCGELQRVPKTKAAVDIGDLCLVEDLTSARWFRGRVQNQKDDLFDVFLIDHGNILSVDVTRISSCSNDLFILPPKIVSGFLANVLLLQNCSHFVVQEYLSSLIGKDITGYIQAFLPEKVLLLEVPDINTDLVQHGFGRHMDRDTFLLLVEMLTEMSLKQDMRPVPDLLIGKPRRQEFSFKPSKLQGYENLLAFCGPRLSCGMHAKVRVTAAIDPGLFYCQMVSMEAALCEMSKKLAANLEYRNNEHSQKTPESLGLLCSVKGKDGNWYRGFVQFLPINSEIRVLFVDYGFSESVKVENIHRLPPDFCSTPFLAFPCSLSSLTGQNEVLKTQQLSFLKAGLLGGVLDVEIDSFDVEQHLYSVTVLGAEDNNVKEPEPIRMLPSTKVKPVFEAEELSPQGGCLYHETAMGKALEKTVEAEEVQVNSVFVGYVEHAQNPNQFWIRTQKRNNEFEEMMIKLADHFSQIKLEEDVLLNPELGTLCCAMYEKDMHFYRAVVTDILEHGAEVLFIDFGNIEKVPHMLIKNIPEKFAIKPAFAICCSLANVFPLHEVWTSTASDCFRRAVLNKALLINIVQMRTDKFVVDLSEMGSDKSQSITELLISSKQAECICIGPMMQSNTKKIAYPQHSGTPDIRGNTEQWKDCEEKEHTNENEKVPGSFKPLNIKPGCEVTVQCSSICSPSNFWCQPLDQVPALDELMNKVQQHYSTHTVPLQARDSCCFAKSPQDGRWYRAVIVERQRNHTTVLLVDYGFTIQVKEHHLQAVMPEYVHLEAQAFRCSLYNLIKPADLENLEDWSPEACNLLKDFVLNCTGGLKCKVVSQLNVEDKWICNVVDLYNTQTQQSVTNMLIEQGLARGATLSANQRLTCFPESFVYSSYDLRPRHEEQVYVTHVSSQWEVYCHLDRNTEIVNKLEEKISEESKKMMQDSIRPVVRKLCLAKYLDGKWYRALVHPAPSPLHFSVFFVDYGNTNISEKSKVMFIPRDSADLLYTPMQALRCCLRLVSKEDLFADVEEWLESAVLNKPVRAVFHGKNDDGSFDVELFDGEFSINEKVKELIFAISCKPKTTVSLNINRKKANYKTDHSRYKLTSVKPHKGQTSSSRTLNAYNKNKQSKRSCVHENRQRMNSKVKQQNKDTAKNYAHVKIQKSSQIKHQREYQDAKSQQSQFSEETHIPELPSLPDKYLCAGFRAKCFVSHINSLNSFFLQLSDDEPAILEMGEKLNSSTVRDSLKMTTSLRIGDLVLAEYEEDGALYRSVVKKCESSSSFNIEFVDYGNLAVVGKEKIYSMPKDYLCQPSFSISCSLLDTSTYENDASFIDAVKEKPLMVDFISQCGTNWEVKVEICDEFSPNTAPEEAFPEKEEESTTSSAETEEKMRSCEQNSLREEVYSNQTGQSEGMPTVENLMPKAPPVMLSTALKIKTRRRHRQKCTRNKRDSKKKTSSVILRNCADAFIPCTIQSSDTENGTILSIPSIGHFYVRLTKTSCLLNLLQSRIIGNLDRCKPVADKDIKEGLECIVHVQKENRWQRAVVQHKDEDKCKVFLVDHGVTEEIPRDSIRHQCTNLAKIPHLAVLCKTNYLDYGEGEDAHKLWCETLKLIIGKEVTLFFVQYYEADNIWMVEVVLNQLGLIHQIKALHQKNKEKISSPAEIQDEGTVKRSTLDSSPPQQLVFAPVNTDKAYVCFATEVTTPFQFCIVLEDLLLVMNKVSLLLDSLLGPMAPLPEAHLVPGTCCLLKSESRNKWCRAEIVHTDATVVLKLIDYGHYECMPRDDCYKLKTLPAEVANLPKMTYPCMLRGVKPAGVDRQWTNDAVVFFQQYLLQKNLQIFFREFIFNTHWKVDILADGVHVAKELVDAGHANYRDVMLGHRFQVKSPCKALLQGPDSEEECGQSNKGSDEAGGKKLLGTRASQCLLM